MLKVDEQSTTDQLEAQIGKVSCTTSKICVKKDGDR